MTNKLFKFDEIKNRVHDSSGVENPQQCLWYDINGVFYPIKEEAQIFKNAFEALKKCDDFLKLDKENWAHQWDKLSEEEQDYFFKLHLLVIKFKDYHFE